MRGRDAGEPDRAGGPTPTCPECAARPLMLISDAPIVSIYKCPRCGNITAPVKQG